MEKDFIDAFYNLSDTLVLLAKSIEDKKEKVEKIMDEIIDSDFISKIENIEIGIQKIIEDNKSIIKKQDDIIIALKQRDNNKNVNNILGNSDKSYTENMKTGITSILLIAGGVLAIGQAFSLLGNVNFESVIALGLTLPLIAFAFNEIGRLDILSNPKTAMNMMGFIITSSLVLVASSYILQNTAPISGNRLLSAIAIAGTLVGLSYSFKIMYNNVDDIGVRDIWKLPLITLSTVGAIVASSYLLQYVRPISIPKLLTTVAIAGMFALLSYNFDKMSKGLNGIKNPLMFALTVPIIFTALSTAVLLSSHLLDNVKVISIPKALTALAITGLFHIMSYSISRINKSMKDVSSPLQFAISVPLLMGGMSLAIYGSSLLLSNVESVTMTQFITAIGITGIMFAMSFSLPSIAKSIEKVGITKALLMPLYFVSVSTSILLSSHLLSNVANISNEKLIQIALLSGTLALSSVVIGGAIWAVNKMLNPSEVVKGALTLVAIAGVIALSSQILNLGNYETYPSLDWAIGTSLSLLAFGVSTVALGAIIMASGGLGAGAIALGAIATLGLAGTITATSHILASGNYDKHPSLEWSKSVALSLVAFGGGTVTLGAMIVGTLGVGKKVLEAGHLAVLGVAKTIVDTSYILRRGVYKNGITEDWARGISMSLGAFAPIYNMLASNSLLSKFGMGVSVSEYTKAISAISYGMLESSVILSSGTFRNNINEEWARSVSLALGAFAPIYERLDSSWFTRKATPDELVAVIKTISESIVESANFFQLNNASFNPDMAPSVEWSSKVSRAIIAFQPAFEFVSDNSGFFRKNAVLTLKETISGIVSSLVDSSRMLSKGVWSLNIPDSYINNLTKSIRGYLDILNMIDDESGFGLFGNKLDKSRNVINNMVSVSKATDTLAKSLSNLNNNIDIDKLNALRTINTSYVITSLIDSKNLERIYSLMESKGEILSNAIIPKNELNSIKRSPTSTVKVENFKENSDDKILDILEKIDSKLDRANSHMSGISNYIMQLQSKVSIR